jgi:hypothetical protein
MSIDEITKRSTIEFPRPLDLEETESLMEYIAKSMPANVAYEKSSHVEMYHVDNVAAFAVFREQGSVALGGTITTLACAEFDSFSCTPSLEDCTKIDKMRFNTIPGYTLEEHRKEVVRLWDSVRHTVLEYFSQ